MSDISLASSVIKLLESSMDLVSNLFVLLLHDSVKARDVVSIIYHISSLNYWLGASLLADGGIIDAAAKNDTAVRNLSYLVDYLGTNSKEIFGDLNGGGGVASVIVEMKHEIDASRVSMFWYTLRLGVEVLVKLMEVV